MLKEFFFKKPVPKIEEKDVVDTEHLPEANAKRIAENAKLIEKNMKRIEATTERGAQIVVESKQYYQRAYFHAVRVAFASIILVGLSLFGNFYQYTHVPEPVYFASTADLRLAPMTPLSEPVMSQGALLAWSVESVSNTLSLDFRNYKRQLTNVRDRYTERAFMEVIASLKASGNLKLIVEKRLSATCIATSAPIISKAGNLRGTYTWIIEFPMVITFEDSSGIQNEQKLTTKVIVERVKTTINPKGILIKQLVTKIS